MIRKNLARMAAGALVALLFSALPANAEITGVTFKTSRNVSFYWGSAISKVLRSQDGVENVAEPYVNLKQGLIKIKTAKDKTVDLAKLVQVLEKEIGFEPVTEVSLELRGRLARRNGKLLFEVSESNQRFEVQQIAGGRPPENQLLEVDAILASPHSADRIVVQQWKAAAAATGEAGPTPAVPAPAATAELAISGMTWGGCARAVREALLKLEGVQAAQVDFPGGWARVTYDPTRIKPEQLPEALKDTRFRASLKNPSR